MYTEYIFDDKKYEVASKNLKSILFDIINAEGSKLADIRQKIDEAEDSELKDKLVNLCNQHETTLLSVLGISNKLNETLQNLDSFSKDLKELENEGIAVIVNNYMEQQNKTNKEVKKENVPEENKKASEVVTEEKTNEEEKVEAAEKTEEAQTVENPEKIEDAVQEEQVEDPVSEVPVIQNNIENGDNSQIFSEDLIEKEKTEEKDDIVNQDNIEDIFSTEKNESAVENTASIVKNTSEEVVSNENSDVPVIESSEEATPAIIDSVPVESSTDENSNDFIPKVVQPEENSSSGEVQPEEVSPSDEISVSEGDEAVSSKSDEIVNDVVDTAPPAIEIDNSIDKNINEDIESAELEGKYVFEKQDSLEPKVILTSANQVAKLRASRDNNTSLLTAKQFFKLENTDNNDQTLPTSSSSDLVFPEAVQNDEIMSQTESVFPQQDLINTNDTGEKELTKEEQMEQMMQQITDLYKEGKVDEAQALSDKVSEMNKELQETQETQKVLAA